jgi:hypothetical protein
MRRGETGRATRRYLEDATPEDQTAFAEALLAAESRSQPARPFVPPSVVWASRIGSILVAGMWVLSLTGGENRYRAVLGLVVILAAAWFPNQVAGATGRLSPGGFVTRVSNPWLLLAVVWLLLLVRLLLL